MRRVSVVALVALVAGILFGSWMTATTASGGLLHEASLRNGDYGSGTAVDTMDPDHGASRHVLGIVDTADGVTFTSTESDGRSNAPINWYIADSADRVQFRSTGTVSFWFKADRGRT